MNKKWLKLKEINSKSVDWSKNWKQWVFTFGKHENETMYLVYLNDRKYLREYLGEWRDEELRKYFGLKEALDACLTHLNSVDPYSR